MAENQAIVLLKSILHEIQRADGQAAVDNFPSLRQVDAKVREAKHIFETVEGLPPNFVSEMELNDDFQANSRRIRLEALVGYIKNAIKFLSSGGITKPKVSIETAPDVSKLTALVPQLKESIDRRWQEAQKCIYAECYLSAIIMMGSILEALLLARAHLDRADVYRSSKAPRPDQSGKVPPPEHWKLNILIEVAVDLGWLKVDRGKFSHALRESRNVVHPWVEVTTGANFDESTCRTSWEVLKASVNDLLISISSK